MIIESAGSTSIFIPHIHSMRCIEPSAPEVKCSVCDNLVKTCSASDRPCPMHPNGIELNKNQWVCSEECRDLFTGVSVGSPFNMDEANYN